MKMNAVANEVVESDAGVIEKLWLDMERTRLPNENLENQVCELESVAAQITINSEDNNSGKADSNDYPDQGSRKELENLKTFLFHNMYWSVDKIMASHSKYYTDQDIALKVPVGFCQSKHNDSGVRDDFCMPLI